MATEKIPLIVDSDTGRPRRMQVGEVLPVANGGTGVATIAELKVAAQLDKVENKSGTDILSGLTSQNVVTALGFTPSSAAGVTVESAAQIYGNAPPQAQWIPHATNPLGSQIGGISAYGGTTGVNSVYTPPGTLGMAGHLFTQTSGDTYHFYGLGTDGSFRGNTVFGNITEFVFSFTSLPTQGSNLYSIGLINAPIFGTAPDAGTVGVAAYLGLQTIGGVDYLSLYISDGINLFVYQGAPISTGRLFAFRIVVVNGVLKASLETISLGRNSYTRTKYIDNLTLAANGFTKAATRIWFGFVPMLDTTTNSMMLHYFNHKTMFPFLSNAELVTKLIGNNAVQNPSGAVAVNVDFGKGASAVTVTVLDPSAVTGTLFICSPQPDGDEYELEPILPQAFCKVNGEVILNVTSLSGLAHGTKRVAYIRG